MEQKLDCYSLAPSMVCIDECDKVIVQEYEATIEYYNKQITELTNTIKNKKRALASFLCKRLDSNEELNKIRKPGAIAICNNMLFVCDHNLKFKYAEMEELNL